MGRFAFASRKQNDMGMPGSMRNSETAKQQVCIGACGAQQAQQRSIRQPAAGEVMRSCVSSACTGADCKNQDISIVWCHRMREIVEGQI
jgi:hypothetical protein